MSVPDSVMNKILNELGACADASMTNNIIDAWNDYADMDTIFPRLRYLYVKRECINTLLGIAYKKVNWSAPFGSLSEGDVFNHLQELYAACEAEIERMEKRATGNRAPAVASMAHTAPVDAAPGVPDPNDSRYRGDPSRRLGGRY